MHKLVRHNKFIIIEVLQAFHFYDIHSIGDLADIQFHGVPVGVDVGHTLAQQVVHIDLVDFKHVNRGRIACGVGVKHQLFGGVHMHDDSCIN